MTTGLLDLPFPEYLAHPGWGSSSLAAMRRGPPARVPWERANPHEGTGATLLGTLVHCVLLTPGLVDSTYVCKPQGMSFASKDGKAWRDAQDPKLEIVAHDIWTTAWEIASAVTAKPAARDTVEHAEHREASLIWDCPTSRERCKGRPDWIKGHWLYDLKVSRHAEGRSLAIRSYVDGWMHQLAHYRTGAQACGLDVRGGRLVVVTPKPPHIVYLLEVKTDSLDLLELENLATLKAMRECRLSGVWPGSSDSWTKVEPPPDAIVAYGEMTLGEIASEEEETEEEARAF